MEMLEERVTRLEEKVDSMEADAKGHFAELRQFITERIARVETRIDALDWKVTWLILPALGVIGSSIVWLAVLVSRGA